MIAIKNILVATDFSEPAMAALAYGRNFARAFGATLHLFHVVDDLAGRIVDGLTDVPNVGEQQTQLEVDARARLQALVSDDDRRMLDVRTATATASSPAIAILAYARDEAVDLIMMGTHSRTGMARLFMGSVAQQVVRTAACPVLTVHHPERECVKPDALQPATTPR